nr:MAG TPA_asm: hypothetical protein [Bacteriophage sp.]
MLTVLYYSGYVITLIGMLQRKLEMSRLLYAS